MTAFEKDIVTILSQDARISAGKIAAMLSVEEEKVKSCIRDLESRGVIVKIGRASCRERVCLSV